MFLRFIHADACRSNLFILPAAQYSIIQIHHTLSMFLLMGVYIVTTNNIVIVFLCSCTVRISLEDIPGSRTAMLLVMHIFNLNRYQQLAFQRFFFVFINLWERLIDYGYQFFIVLCIVNIFSKSVACIYLYYKTSSFLKNNLAGNRMPC